SWAQAYSHGHEQGSSTAISDIYRDEPGAAGTRRCKEISSRSRGVAPAGTAPEGRSRYSGSHLDTGLRTRFSRYSKATCTRPVNAGNFPDHRALQARSSSSTEAQ